MPRFGDRRSSGPAEETTYYRVANSICAAGPIVVCSEIKANLDIGFTHPGSMPRGFACNLMCQRFFLSGHGGWSELGITPPLSTAIGSEAATLIWKRPVWPFLWRQSGLRLRTESSCCLAAAGCRAGPAAVASILDTGKHMLFSAKAYAFSGETICFVPATRNGKRERTPTL
jgi:hypothetical protein